jgi:hypothetical protein
MQNGYLMHLVPGTLNPNRLTLIQSDKRQVGTVTYFV